MAWRRQSGSMTTLTDQNRQLAGTLRSLSLPDPVTTRDETQPAPRPAFRWLLLIGLGSAALALTAAVLVGTAPETAGTSVPLQQVPPPPPAPPPAPLAAREITGSGHVTALQSVPVFARYEGRIENVNVTLGSEVQEGAVLAVLKEPAASLALDQARARLRTAEITLTSRQITLAQASADLRRAEALAARGSLSQSALETAGTAARTAANAVELAEAGITEARVAAAIAAERVASLTILAPFAGTITQLNARPGAMVLDRADGIREADSLLTLTRMDSLVIEADVAERSIAGLVPGLLAEAELDAAPGAPFPVRLSLTAPEANPAKGTFSLRFTPLESPITLRPGMAARIRISLPSTTQTAGATPR
ncbi:Macrolide-specific efflux protein macA precursor [Pannonibacter phragmitetus]|uniref:Macrolide-specific efflux protein macA n=2 Tax=Pannonibacter phragmitetus TaxID=121719 RepID=A0A378ZT35_9HYPH|nr:Macrolide-specific efflux protein macA precursor [Pannonibacter phragmitetus]